MHEEEYVHDHGDGHVHTHSHDRGDGHVHTHHIGEEVHGHHHDHSHTHDPAQIKKIVNRLSKSIGHLESVKRMVEDGRDCTEVLVQLAAVRSEINNAGKALLKEHMAHCIVEAVEENDDEAVEKLNDVIDKFMK